MRTMVLAAMAAMALAQSQHDDEEPLTSEDVERMRKQRIPAEGSPYTYIGADYGRTPGHAYVQPDRVYNADRIAAAEAKRARKAAKRLRSIEDRGDAQ